MSETDFPIYLQYQNSPKLKQLCNSFSNALLFKDFNFAEDYLNIKTAKTEGLNIWGIILGQPRRVKSGLSYDNVFGFKNSDTITDTKSYPQNFYYSNFFNPVYSPTIDLTDDQYRALLLLIYRSKNTNNSIYDMNRIIQQYSSMMGASGIPAVYVSAQMEITYKFNYFLEAYESYLFTHSTVLPCPAGVKLTILF